MLFILFHHLGN